MLSKESKPELKPFDADENYRDRLAAVVMALCPDGGREEGKRAQGTTLVAEIYQLLESDVYRDEPSALKEKESVLPPEKKLSERLRRHPGLQSRLALLTQYTTSKWMLEWELKCRGALDREDETTDAYEKAKTVQSVGLCLSGGGIRSATFNLGILQGIARLGRLAGVDYLSSVSGGGYIHQFLAAWIYSEGMGPVQRKLDPIPAEGSSRVIAPEPIRWLRRYSNYLSPSVSILGADMWTIASVWVRNTLLNLVILISAITTLLLLPHSAITEFALTPHPFQSLSGKVAVFVLGSFCGLFAVLVLKHSFPHFCAKPEGNETQPVPACRKDTTRGWHPYAIVTSWLVLSMFTAPVAYRLSVPGGSQSSARANKVYKQRPPRPTVSGHVTLHDEGDALQGQWTLCADNAAACKPDSVHVPDVNRLQFSWRKRRPEWALPRWLGFIHIPGRTTPEIYLEHQLVTTRPGTDRSPQPASDLAEESSLLWLYECFPLLCILFCSAIWFGQKETTRGWKKCLSILCPIVGGMISVALIFGIEQLFFVATFTVDQKLITALGITLLPSLLLAVPFISLELSTGLFGTLLGSAQREWVARLRAVSFQIGILWLVLVGLSLIGPYLFDLVAHQAVVKYAVWSTWSVSTISGVLLGKSRSTSGKAQEGADPSESSGWSLKEVVVKIAPPIFVAGLFILLATFTSWLLQGHDPYTIIESTERWFLLTAISLITSILFSWRIDINEFSMNAFYRDRLARCYAGASNMDRQPNHFTGFDIKDGALRVASLLPVQWRTLEEETPGKYQGPYPIFCTALNLTTGKELAYQERKAASFAITPLFSGYSTGWTDGSDPSMHYNGFVPTTQHVRAPQGMTVASAVAISGAAASPNMGFHSSTAMAFLMTIFNVRLGWWSRNPRRNAPDSPAVGLWQLIKELIGSTNDTSPFVYLSDGGHFDNMGLHELLRRRCHTIIICDAEADGTLCFEGIGMAIRKARVDLGIEVEITRVVPTQGDEDEKAAVAVIIPSTKEAQIASETAAETKSPDKENPSGAEGLLQFKHFPGNLFHALEGKIHYPEDKPGDEPGKLLYIKSTLTGDEPADILNYHRMHPNFPFDTTLDQFFSESQFESYRRLGEHIVDRPRVRQWIQQNIPAVPEK